MIEIEEIIKKIEKGENNHNDLTYFICSSKLTNAQLIRILFKTLTHSTLKFKDNEYDSNRIFNIAKAIYNLLNNECFTPEEIDINEQRINKALESLEQKKSKKLIKSINLLKSINMKKYKDSNEMLLFIKKLIKRQESISVIKRFMLLNKVKEGIKLEDLFDYTFDRAIFMLEVESTDIFYYIALLKLFYTKNIDKNKYIKKLNTCSKKNNLLYTELLYIINGYKNPLSKDQILDKYDIISFFEIPNIILPNKLTTNEQIFTIDKSHTNLMDDGISIRKDGNNYIIGIYIADVGGSIKQNSLCDQQARQNFQCIYHGSSKLNRIFSSQVTNKLSLKENEPRRSLSIHVVMSSSGNILDYFISKDNIVVSKNLSYLEAENMINSTTHTKLERQLRDLFTLSNILEETSGHITTYARKNNSNSNYKSHKIMREFTILYNSLIARKAYESKMPFVYKIQNSQDMSELAEDCGVLLDDETKSIINFSYLESINSPLPDRFASLDLDVYANASNPLREYVDFYNQLLMHGFYFYDTDLEYNPREFGKLINYFNRRSRDLEIMQKEFTLSKKN